LAKQQDVISERIPILMKNYREPERKTARKSELLRAVCFFDEIRKSYD